jgi:hypothetical protein
MRGEHSHWALLLQYLCAATTSVIQWVQRNYKNLRTSRKHGATTKAADLDVDLQEVATARSFGFKLNQDYDAQIAKVLTIGGCA